MPESPSAKPAKRRPSPAVRRRRRLTVTVLSALLIVFGVLFVVSRVTGSGPAEPEKVKAPKTVAAHGNKPQPQLPECTPEELSVKPHIDSLSYKSGQYPEFSLTVENTGRSKCVANVGTKTMKFIVHANGEEVWNSTHCQKGGDTRKVILKPHQPLATETITWDRSYSAPDTCDQKQRKAAPTGEIVYKLSVEVAGVKSKEPAQFLLQK